MCASRKRSVVAKILKILGWSVLTIVVVVSILLFCVVKYLDTKNLSPLVERVANDYIDGHLKVGSLKIGFNPRFPILGVEVKDLSVISHAFQQLTPEERGLLPNYADSLITLDAMSGSLDLKRLVIDNELALRDVVLNGLSVNVVIAHNGKANYEVMKAPADTTKASKSKMPGFRINKFALEKPREIRFYNAADSTSASVLLLTDAAVDGEQMPTYRLKMSGNVTSPKATLITNLEQIDFGLNGKVFWDPARPGLVAVDEMELQGAFIKAIVAGEIDLQNDPIARNVTIDLKPVAVTDLLTVLPDSVRRQHRLYPPYFTTDATIGGRLELLKPMNLTTDTIPAARLNIVIPPSTLHYGQACFEELALDVAISTLTNQPDSTLIDISRCVIAGPATRFEASARLATPVSDMAFEADLQGDIDLANLPPILHEKIAGYLSGIVTTDLRANGRASMLKAAHLHELVADGAVDAKNVYFLTGDLDKMVEVKNAKIRFDSDRLAGNLPLLHTTVDVDTANLLMGGVDIAFSDLNLNAGVTDGTQLRDTTLLPPIEGRLSVDRLNIISITDSAGGRIRDISGNLTLRRFKREDNVLELLPNLLTRNVSAGSLSDRILLNDTKIHASLFKLPSAGKKKHEEKKKAPAMARDYRYVRPDSVFRLAYLKRHHKPGEKRKRRVYGKLSADNQEVLEWDLTKGFDKFLREWRLQGTVNTNQGRLLTPVFPLHNHFSRIDLRFNNDTVRINDIMLRVGKSDLAISGLVSNVSRAMTAKTDNTLKVNLALMSDTIDINELSIGAFTGATYSAHRRKGKTHAMATADDAKLASRLDDLAKKGPGKASPLLIPVNVEGNVKIGADHVLYSDLALRNMGGDILVYDGGVNLHDIKASSDAGNISLSALYSAPKPEKMQFGFGLELDDFNIGKFVKLVPAIDSIVPLMHDFSGLVSADIAATCRIDSGMNLELPTLNAAIRISGDDLAFIDPEKYRTLGKWLGFKNKSDNTIKSMNVQMTVADGLMRVYPFAFNIDRYRLGVSGFNDIAMNFDYHISVLKSPIPFKFGINISGSPKKYKVRFGGAKYKEDKAIESVNIVDNARINLIDQIENVFKRGVQNSRFAKVQVATPPDFDFTSLDSGLTPADSLRLIQEGLLPDPAGASSTPDDPQPPVKKDKKKRKKFLFF